MTNKKRFVKRTFDIFLSLLALILFWWLILVLVLLSIIFVKGNGIFKQKRIGQYGKLFTIYKIETINLKEAIKETPKISKYGQYLRTYKLDEFPQFWNVFEGTMSFVGPRPDLPGFADKLEGEATIILNVKPGITGPASLFFRNEEELLKNQKNSEEYNREIIWPKKVAINIQYVKEYRFVKDIYYIIKTLFS